MFLFFAQDHPSHPPREMTGFEYYSLIMRNEKFSVDSTVNYERLHSILTVEGDPFTATLA